MNSTKRMLAAAGLATILTFGVTTAEVRADVIPSSWSVAAGTVGFVPSSPILDDYSGVLSGSNPVPTNTLATATLTIQPPVDGDVGSEASFGDAYAAVDPLGFNSSSVGASSMVRTGQTVSNLPPECLCLANTSGAFLSATLENPLGGGATVDLTLQVDGVLTLLKQDGDSGISPEQCIVIEDVLECFPGSSEMSASVFVVLALGDLSPLLELELDLPPTDPDAEFPVLVGVGAASLVWVEDEDNPGSSKAEIFTFGAFDDAVFTEVVVEGVGCTANFCKMLVELTLTVSEVQLLGLGEEFEAGLLLITDASIAESKVGREAEADFFNTASVSATFLPTAVPAPGSLLLLGLGLLGMGAARRRRTLH